MGGDTGEQPAEARSFLAFELRPELLAKTEAIIDKLRSADDRRAHAAELIEVVLELTRSGLDAYYFQPLELAAVGFTARSTAKAGIATGAKGISMIVRRVLGSMSNEQLLTVADFMDGILIQEAPSDSTPGE